ncbi:hypothetical protein CMK11_03620, partial [Candidatus Poribacteria bacterium]|nr:hypothetical protein [Candidatus Poribacteria bacterium]
MSTTRLRWTLSALIVSAVLAAVAPPAPAVESADGVGPIGVDNWALSISASGDVDGEQHALARPLQLGVHPLASDAFDQGIDLLSPPPPPGVLIPEAYLFDADAASFLSRRATDMRGAPAEALTSLAWTLIFSNSSDSEWTLVWDVAGMPDQWTPLRIRSDDGDTDLDMRATQDLAVPAGDAVAFTIEATLQAAGDVRVNRMLSAQSARVSADARTVGVAGINPVFIDVSDAAAAVPVSVVSSDPDVVTAEVQDGNVVLIFGTAGDAFVTVQAVNADGSPGPSVTFPVVVLADDALNRPPTVESMRPVVIEEGTPKAVTIEATDPDGDPLFVSLVGVQRVGRASEGDAPLEVTLDFDLPRIRLLAPGVARREARFLVSLTVDDGLHEPVDLELLVVALSSNRPPAVSAAELVPVAAGEAVSVTVSATDPDGDAVTLMAGLRGISGAPTVALAAAVRAFNQADGAEAGGAYTKLFEYTTDGAEDGSYVDISWTADDGVGSASARTRVVVGDVDLPPLVEPIPRQSVDEGDTLVVEITASDPEGGPLTSRITGMSGGASFDPNTLVFLWPLVPFGAAGRHMLTVHLTDEAGSTTVTPIDITVVDVNQPPTVVLGDAPAVEAAQLTIVRGSETVYAARAFDADGDDVQLAIVDLPDWARGRRVGDRKNPAAVLALQAPADAEPFAFVVRARDAGGLTAEGTVSVTIEEPANLAPRIEAPLARSVLTGDTLSAFVPVVDPDGDSVTLSVSPRPAGLQVADVAGGFRLTWTPAVADARDEPYDLTLTVSDERGAEATASFLISVSTPANRPPTGGDAVPVVVREGGQVDLDLLAGVIDPDGDSLSLELTTDLPPTAFTLPAAETVLTVAPGVGDAGAYTAEVAILDGRGGRLVHGWSITVPGDEAGRLEILSTTPTVIESTIDGAYRFVAVITTPDDRPPDRVTVTVTHNSGLSRELDMQATGIGDLADGAVFAVQTRLPEGVYRYVIEAALDEEVRELRGEGPRVGATLVAFAQIRALGRTGRIPFVYALLNPNPAGRTNLLVEYRRDLADPWAPAAVTGDLVEVTSGVQLGFVWDSDVDVPDAASEAIQIRVTPEDGVPRILTIRVANVPPAAPTLDPVAP